jgi:P4 family phage/plasmid primase-like protien
LSERGYQPPQKIAFGKIIRFSREGSQSDSCWLVCFQNFGVKNGKPYYIAVYGDYATGEKEQWRSEFEYSPEDGEEIKLRLKQQSEAYEKDKLRYQNEVAKTAEATVEKANREGASGYLARKHLQRSYGAMYEGADLIVPLFDIHGRIWSYQRIAENGEKRFLAGGRKRANFFPITAGKISNLDHLLVVEGFATGASIHEATGLPVFVAFDAGNLEPVGQALRQKFPEANIAFCADNDAFKPANAGIEKATAAAKAVFGQVILPRFADTSSRPTDFNDLHCLDGLDEVKRQITRGIETAPVEIPDLSDKPSAHELALNFVASNRLHIFYHREDFFFYDGKKYRQSAGADGEELKARINEWFRSIGRFDLRGKSMKLGEMLSLLKSPPHHIPWEHEAPLWADNGTFKPANHLLPLQNGLFDVAHYAKSGEAKILPHSHKFFCTYVLPFSYDPNAKCPTYEHVAKATFGADDYKLLWEEIMGAHFYQPFPLEHFFMLQGQGRNGKSVLANILTCLIGRENISSVPLECFNSENFMLSHTYGKLANIVSDQNRIDRFNEGMLKQFVSREPIMFNRKHKDSFIAKPTAFLTIICNEEPQIYDSTDGVWRRVIPFRLTNQVEKGQEDRKLLSPEFWMGSGELAGVFNLALAGLRRVVDNYGFNVPKGIETDKEAYRQQSNPIAEFMGACLEFDVDSRETTEGTYGAYARYCRASGMKPMPRSLFSRQFPNEARRQGVRCFSVSKTEKSGGKHFRFYSGIRIFKNWHDESEPFQQN